MASTYLPCYRHSPAICTPVKAYSYIFVLLWISKIQYALSKWSKAMDLYLVGSHFRYKQAMSKLTSPANWLVAPRILAQQFKLLL